jgi:hypothetical protein
MDILLKSFHSIFRTETRTPQDDKNDVEEIKSLQNRYPDIFLLVLLDFIKICTDNRKSEIASGFLMGYISGIPTKFIPNPQFLTNILNFFIEVKSKTIGTNLLETIAHMIEKDPSFHSFTFEYIAQRFPSAYFDLPLRLLCVLSYLYKFASPQLVQDFSCKHAETLYAYLSQSHENSTANHRKYFIPFYDQVSIIECLMHAVRKGVFWPFQSKFPAWHSLFKSIIWGKDFYDEPSGRKTARERTLTLYYYLHTFLSIDDPFKLELLQTYTKDMVQCCIYFLNNDPTMNEFQSGLRFIFATLSFPNLFRAQGFFEGIFGSCCAPSLTFPKEPHQNNIKFDSNFINLLKKLILRDKTFFFQCQNCFWERDNELTLQCVVHILIEEHPNYYDVKDLESRNICELQSLCLNSMISNNMIPIDQVLQHLTQPLRNTKNESCIEKSLYLLGKLSGNSKFPPSFLNLDSLATFLAPPFSLRIRITSTCCLTEMFYHLQTLKETDQRILNIVYLNIFDDDLIFAYCSARCLGELKYPCALAHSFFVKNCRKLIERFFLIVEKVRLYSPLIYIINRIGVTNYSSMKEEFLIFTRMLCDLGESFLEVGLENPESEKAQSYLGFLNVLDFLLCKFSAELSVLDSFFNEIFLHFIFINQPKMTKLNPNGELLSTIYNFDNFIDKVLDYILAKKHKYQGAADVLNFYLKKNFHTIDKETMNTIRDVISNQDDLTVKSRLSLFFSTSEA